jgi:DNA integrity scanning protein DisA with diadenylate cyclase activity
MFHKDYYSDLVYIAEPLVRVTERSHMLFRAEELGILIQQSQQVVEKKERLKDLLDEGPNQLVILQFNLSLTLPETVNITV